MVESFGRDERKEAISRWRDRLGGDTPTPGQMRDIEVETGLDPGEISDLLDDDDVEFLDPDDVTDDDEQ